MTKSKLSKTEFINALKRGQGRALMHVQQYGLEGISSILLKSCLKNLSYDRQCESSRTEWLFSMFCRTEDLPKFSASILSSLNAETELYDLQHLCEFAELLSKNGDLNARHLLREIVLKQPLPSPHWPYGTHQLVALDGIDAVIAIAKRFGSLLLDKKPESSIWLGDFADEIPSAERKLVRIAKNDPDIKAFLENQKDQKKRFFKNPKTKSKKEVSEIELSCEDFISHFFTKVRKEDYHFELKMMDRRLARNADDEDLIALLERLNDEKDESVIVRVLRIFTVVELPKIPPLFWKLVESKSASIRDTAIDALAKIQDTRLNEIARKKLMSKNFTAKDTEYIKLFIENFEYQDEYLILNALKQNSLSDEIAHSVGFAIREIYRANKKLVTSELLQWDYERNPCTECRCSTVRLLIDLKGMTPEIAEECQYDSNEEIRELVQKAAEIS